MYFFPLQLVCEEVNVDRFYPVLYPKVGTSPPFVFFQIPLSLLLPAIHTTPHLHEPDWKLTHSLFLRHQGSLSPLMSMWSATTSSLELFIKSLARWVRFRDTAANLCFWCLSWVNQTENVLSFLYADIRGGAVWEHGRKSCLCWVIGVSGPQDWASWL